MSVATQQIVLQYDDEQKLLLKNLINIRFRRALAIGLNLNISVISNTGIPNTTLINDIIDADMGKNIQTIQLNRLTSLCSQRATNWVNETISVMSALRQRNKASSPILKKYSLTPSPINILSGGFPGIQQLKSVIDLKIYIEAPFYIRLLGMILEYKAGSAEIIKKILQFKKYSPLMDIERSSADIIVQLPYFIGPQKLSSNVIPPEKGTLIVSWQPESEMDIKLMKHDDLYCLFYYWYGQPICHLPLELKSMKKICEIDFKAIY